MALSFKIMEPIYNACNAPFGLPVVTSEKYLLK